MRKLTSVDFEINEVTKTVALVVTPIDFRMEFPFDMFIEFANLVSSVRWKIMPSPTTTLTLVTRERGEKP